LKRKLDRFSRQMWAVVLVFALLGAGAAILRQYLKEYNYSATATVYVTPPISSNPGDALVADQYAGNRTQLYRTLIESPVLAREVIDRLKLDQTPDELTKRVEAKATPLTSLLSITATGSSPGDARTLVTAYADSLPSFAKTIEGSGGLRGAPSVVAVAYPVPEDPSFVRRYGLLIALAVGGGLLGFLYSYWYQRRYPNVRTAAQLRRELRIALAEEVDINAPVGQLRRLQAQLFTKSHDDACLMIVGAKSHDRATTFSELLSQSIRASGREVLEVESSADGTERASGRSDALLIVDIPALLESSASAAALHDSDCGQAVLVTLRNVTSLRDAIEVRDLLTVNNINLRGAIILRRGSRSPWRRHSEQPDQPVISEDASHSPWPVIDVLEAEKHGRTVRAD
jgi:capsular polysaccharide biosynthesis protein